MKTLVGPYLHKWQMWLTVSVWKKSSRQKQTALMIRFKASPPLAERILKTGGEERKRSVCVKHCEWISPCAVVSTIFSATPRETVLTVWTGSQWTFCGGGCLHVTNKSKLHLKSDCMFFFAQEDNPLLAETLLEVMFSHQCNRHKQMSETLSLKAWGRWNSMGNPC